MVSEEKRMLYARTYRILPWQTTIVVSEVPEKECGPSGDIGAAFYYLGEWRSIAGMVPAS
jgi:hypothetical protein